MKRIIKRVKTEKLSISLPVDMVAWLQKKAELEENGNVSSALRRLLLPMIERKK